MNIIKIEVPEYNPEKGFEYKWEKGFEIEILIDGGITKIIANREGLMSLANHLLNLSQSNIPSGSHLHFDEFNSLEEGSTELIIKKKGI